MTKPIQNADVHLAIALAAAGRDDHVHLGEEFGVALDARAVECETCRIDADALPGFHLALIVFLRDLLVEIERNGAMHDIGRERRGVGGRRFGQALPMRIEALAKAGHDADAGDPDFALVSHGSPPWETRFRPRPSPCWRGMTDLEIRPGGTSVRRCRPASPRT